MYHVKAFYPNSSFNRDDKQVIGCMLYSDENAAIADRVRDNLRRTNGDKALYFTHDDDGNGTSSLTEVRFNSAGETA